MRIIQAQALIDCSTQASPRWRYEVIVHEIITDGLTAEGYGLSVTDALTGECAQVRDITLSQVMILELLTLLRRLGVPPVALKDVIEDYLANYP